MDDLARREASQKNRPKGLVWDDENITLWAKSWSEIINDARTKLNFFNAQLSYQADRESAKEYLQKAHAHFIPESYIVAEDESVDLSSSDDIEGED